MRPVYERINHVFFHTNSVFSVVDAGARSFSERPLLPVQPQAPALPRSSSDKAPEDSSKKQKKTQAQMPPGLRDPLYSLSSASIRARKNALEMENIQRASHLYSDYIGKIKSVLAQSPCPSPVDASSSATPSASPDPPSDRSLGAFGNMDVDMQETTEDTYRPSTLEQNDQAKVNDLEEDPLFKEVEPLQALRSMARSGLLHSLVQQYFTLIHPQFMILHKNHFLVRFWADYGPFPEAHDIHVHVMHNQEKEVWTGPTVARPPGPKALNDSGMPLKTNPLLLLAMLALVSRHIPDRTSLKSTAEERTRRLEQSLRLVSVEFLTKQPHLYHKTPYEAHLHELMETDELGQDYATQENLRDRGEQYFQWALQFLKSKYEDPSLTVVQSLLLLREYAIMAGYHSQAYMYGGNAITMAMQLGWHHAHSQNEDNDNNINTSDNNSGNTDHQGESQKGQEKAQDHHDKGQEKEKGKQADSKAAVEEQMLCWWHCFIVDRWMSAAYNRPVVKFDRSESLHLQKNKHQTYSYSVTHVHSCPSQYNRTFPFISLTRPTCCHFLNQSPRGPCLIVI